MVKEIKSTKKRKTKPKEEKVQEAVATEVPEEEGDEDGDGETEVAPAEETTIEDQVGEVLSNIPTFATVNVGALRNAMQLLSPVVPKKPTIKALSNVLLQDGRLMATNMEVAVAIDIPEAEGSCLLPISSVLGLIKYVPSHELLTIEQGGTQLKLSWNGGSASYTTDKIEDYPQLPEVKKDVVCTVEGDILVTALSEMTTYCATDTQRPVLAGVALTMGDSVDLAAGDGYRAACKTLRITIPPGEDIKAVIIPAATIGLLQTLWEKGPRAVGKADSLVEMLTSKGKLDLAFGKNHFSVRFGSVVMVSQLIGGTAVDFKKLIPQDPPMEIRIFAPDLELAINRVKKAAGSNIVRLAWQEGSMEVSAINSDNDKINVSMPIHGNGDSGRVAIDLNYLLAYLKGKTGLVTMGVKDESSVVTFRYPSSPDVAMMPMKAQW